MSQTSNPAIKKMDISVTGRNTNWESVKLTNSKDCEKVCRMFFHEDIELYESFFLLLLSASNEVTGYVKISQGGITGTVVDKIIVAKYAIDTLSKGVVLCHNHPSGNLQPSEADISLTKSIKGGLGLFDIKVVDHIIITANSYYSFSDSGTL